MKGALYREILAHSSVYAIGLVLARLTSILLLPVYTRYLTPTGYGVVALLDLIGALIGQLTASGQVTAAGRYHLEIEDERHRDRVWWTTLAHVVAVGLAIAVPAFIFRRFLGNMTLGPEIGAAPTFYALFLPTIVLSSVEYTIGAYFRVLKRSALFVAVSTGRLALNAGLNLTFLIGLHMGVFGVLLGNLIAGAAAVAVLFWMFVKTRGRPRIDSDMGRSMWRFAWPLIGSGLLATLMHQADRYILRAFVSLEDIGIYSLAYQIGQGVNALVLTPFGSIWGVLVFEIAKQREAKSIYAEVFTFFMFGLGLILLGVSLFSDQIVALIAAPSFARASEIVPVICLAYLFFSLHEHFKAPSLIAGRTVSTLHVMLWATAANIVLNVLWAARWGITGAAWASVATFVVFAVGGLLQYRRIDVYPYQFFRCGAVVGAMTANVIVLRYVHARFGPSGIAEIAVRAAVFGLWAIAIGRIAFRARSWLPAVGQ
jgi:O-antigen/teichoic acid export membrane protein